MRRRIRYLAAGLLAVAPLLAPTAVTPFVSEGDPKMPAHVVATFQDGRIDESSGLVVRGDRIFTVNDSGDGPYVYQVDRSTGRTTRVITYGSDQPDDVEALAGAGGALWVGDIGDNRRWRDSIRVHRLVPGREPGTLHTTTFDLTYPDSPHDAETLLVDPRNGRLLVVTKSWATGGVVYAAPRHLREGETAVLQKVARVPGLVTDGTFLPGGRRVVLRTYGSAEFFSYPGFRLLGQAALPRQEQGEGIAVNGASVYLSSEGERSAVLAVGLRDLEHAAMGEAAQASRPQAKPAPPSAEAPRTDRDPRPWMGLGPAGYTLAVVATGATVVLLRVVLRRSRRRR